MSIAAGPVLEEARRWTAEGHFVVPIPAGSKAPAGQGWQNLRIKEDELAARFSRPGMGMGVLLGITSLIDVDLDCDEARAIAPVLLPPTGRIHGRAGAPDSHWWYLMLPDADRTRFTTKAYDDPSADTERARMLELRGLSRKGTPQQTVVPPSLHHPSGEEIVWTIREAPESVPGVLLIERCELLAFCVMAARTWPASGRRHQAALALAGVLCRRRLDEEEVADAVLAVAVLAGDEEAAIRRDDARDTYHAHMAGESVTGLPQLLDTLRLDTAQRQVMGRWAGTRETFTAIPKVAHRPINGLVSDVPSPNEANGSNGTGPGRSDLHVGEQDLAVITPRAWEAVRLSNDPPRMFRYGESVVRLQRNDEDAPVLAGLDADRLRHELALAANCYKNDRTGGRQSARPPKDVVIDMLAVADPPLPVLRRVVEAPVFAADGQLQTEPGYHPASKTYYAKPAGFILPPLPTDPSPGDLETARRWILVNLLTDFPFVSDADRAGAVALFLLPYCRDFIPGPTPNHLIEAPEPGSGKGLLANALLSPSVGRNIGGITEARDDDEWRKRITAQLREGAQVVLIDNVRKSLDSSALASALTQLEWKDRLLGQSEMVRYPVRCIWVTTANNPSMTTEMARRCIRIRLDARSDQPWRRPLESFKHPELARWLATHRGELVWAALTVIRRWLALERPDGAVRPLGSYEDWSKVMGGILDTAGIPGFLGNLDELYADVDTHGAVWRIFVGLWWQKFNQKIVGVSELFPLAEEVEGLPLSGSSERGQKSSFGRLLNAQRDRVIGEHRVVRAGTAQRASQWCLQPVEGEQTVLTDAS